MTIENKMFDFDEFLCILNNSCTKNEILKTKRNSFQFKFDKKFVFQENKGPEISEKFQVNVFKLKIISTLEQPITFSNKNN